MATNFWDCSECKHRGPADAFVNQEWLSVSEDERVNVPYHICPQCHSEDVFPWRKFRCLGCGFTEEQPKFFGWKNEYGKYEEADLDPDPIEAKWKYDCSEQNNPYCDSDSYEQIDESTEAPKQKLYILRRCRLGDVWYFEEEKSKRAMTEIFYGNCPVGTRVAVQQRQFGRDYIAASVRAVIHGTHAPVEAFEGDSFFFESSFNARNGIGYGYSVRAANEKLDEYPWLLLFLPRMTYGDRESWTTDQWLEDMTMKDAAQAVRAFKAEEVGQRRMKEIEDLIGDREKTNAFVIKHKDKTTEEILKLAKELVKRRKTKKN